MTRKELIDAVNKLNESYGTAIEIAQAKYPPSSFAIFIKDRPSFLNGLKKSEVWMYLLGVEAGILFERNSRLVNENPLLVGLTRDQLKRLIVLVELGYMPTESVDYSFKAGIVRMSREPNETASLIDGKDLWNVSGEIKEYIQKSMIL